MRKQLLFLTIGIMFLAMPLLVNAQKKFVSDAFWTEVNEKAIPQSGKRYITPKSYKTFKLNLMALRSVLNVAPMEFTPIAQMTKTYLELPMPDGSIKTFDIVESPIMAAELAEQFPDINTYAGYAVDDNNITVRFDYTLQGFHAMILIPGQSTIFIDPYSFGGGDMEHYVVYHRKDYASSVPKSFECGVTDTYTPRSTSNEPDLKSAFGSCELRTYRLALAATGEYTAFHGGTVALALAAQTTTMNRINAVYGREMAIRMNLVANNNLIIYTNAGSDPYTNTNGGTMLGQNQTNCNAAIGSANYDIGHVFSTGGGGIAQLGCVCTANKAQGVTGSPAPIGDPFDIDYVAHEMGHQFACNHTFNNNDDGSCAGNTNTTTSMEPGSGSTIMAYAGICNPSNVQNNSNDYFHVISLQEMGAFITGGGHTCPVKTTLSNSTPAVTTASSAIVIPQGTPFFLTANGTDPNTTNVLTYCWEQTNTGTATTSPSATATAGANFRSFNPTTNPTRFFPSLSALAANGPFTWEVLPTVARTMTFRATVRDNATGGGCTAATSNVTVTVNSATGPFTVTNPTNTGISWVGASTQTITWNVANTTNAPVSCANVDILISTDGGVTYTVLLSNTPNDGTQAITAPNTPSTTCRIMVRCAGGNFFDISNNNFTITAATSDYTISVTNPSVSVCQPANAVYNITSTSIGGYSNPITLSVTGVPAGGTATFGTNTITPGNGTTLTISGTGGIAPGTYNLALTGTSTSGVKNVSLVLIVSTGSPTAVTLLAPTNGATAVTMPVNFSWTASSGTGISYAIQISPSATFTPITDQATGLAANSYASSLLSPSTTYFWRVTASNGCGTAPASTTFSFTTGVAGCDTISNFLSTHTAVVYSAGVGLGYVSGQNTYGDLGKADKFTYTGANTHIRGAFIGFGRAVASNATNTFNVRVWDGTTGSPTTVLATTAVTYQSVQTLIAGGSNVGFVNFGSIPLPASKIFFVGIEFTYGADTIVLITNTNGQTTPATAWEKLSNGTWVPYDDATSWPLSVAHFIRPVLGIPTDANFTPAAPVVCAGNSITLTNTSTAATSYSWTFASGNPATSTATNPTVLYSAPGTFSIRLIANNACMTDTVTANISVNSVSTTVASTNVSCNGGTNGTASITASGGVTPYAFSWSNGRTTASNTGLTAGTYTVTVTDANSCTTTRSITITQPSAITATATNTNVSCNGGTNGSATIATSGGTTPYVFSWSNGRTTASNTGLTAGTYTVTVTDGAGCSATRTVTVTQPSAITVTATNTNASCNGASNGSATATASGGTSPYTFNWGAGVTSQTRTGLTAGTYTVTVTDAASCSATRSVTVTQPSAITATTTNTNVSCNGGSNGSATINASGGSSPYTFNWSNGRTTTSNTGLSAGTYTLTVTDATACSVTRSVTVTQPSALSATTTAINISCNGGTNGSATIVGAGGTTPYTFSWSNGRTTASNTGLTVGTYTVTITDANLCSAIRNLTITQPSAITATATNTNLSCNGASNASASVTAAGGTSPYTFNWGAGVTSQTRTGLAAGTYTATVTDANGCSATRTVTVTQPSAITATATNTNTSCNGGSNGSATVTAAGGTTPYTFNWGAGVTTQTRTGLAAGTYIVTVTDANACSVTRSVTVTQPAVISIVTNSTPQNCNPNTGTASATASGGTGAISYLWNTGAITNSINSLNTGTFTVTVTDANGCTAVTTVTVGNSCVPCTLSGSATNVNVSCNGGSNGSTVAVPASGTTPYSFLWSNGRTTATNSGLTAGTYSVTITDANNCTATASTTVTQPSAITATATNTNVSCNGASNASASITAAGGTSPYTFNWGAGVTSQTRTGLAAGTYTATVTDANGCVATRTVTVTQPSAITLTATNTNTSCNGGSNGSATVTAAGGTTPYAFNWGAGVTTQTRTGLAAGTYIVTVTDANACSVTRSVTVTQPAVISIATSSTPQNCNPNTGTASATASGGTGALSYLWNTGAITNSINSLNTGTFTVTVTDANGCTAIATVTVGNSCLPCTLSGSATNVNVSCAGGSNGSATAVPASGATPYSFLWSNGRTTASNSGLTAGTYTVTITDANNCTATASTTVTQPTVITISTASTPQNCNPNTGTASATATGGTGALTFLWNTGAITNSINSLNTGTFTVTVTDANLCNAIATVSVGNSCVPCTLSGSATNVNVSCNGGSNGAAVAVPAGGTTPISFLWSNSQTTSTITGLSAGTYSVIFTDANNCTATAATTVSQPSAITVTTTSTPQNCTPNTGAAFATASGGTGALLYAWSTGESTPVINNLNSGAYTVTVTDANGCTSFGSVTVGINCSSSINTTEPIERFAVLPNPSNGYFSIQIDLNSFEQINLRMTDVLGRTIEEMQLEGKSFTIPMDWDRLAGGTYFITLYSGGKFKTEKVVISK